jgi:hypothetical protein
MTAGKGGNGVVASVQLSQYAARLLHVLTAGGVEDDPIIRQPVDSSRIGDRELGVLLAAAQRLPARHPAFTVRWAVEEAVRHRQPVFTAESCAALLAALVDSAATGSGGNPMLAVNALARCDGPWPEHVSRSAGTLVRSLVAFGRREHPFALLALAGVAGGLTGRLATGLFKRPLAPIARDEVDVLSRLDARAMVIVAEVSDSAYASPPTLPDAWPRLASIPEYASFARGALAAAAERVAAIHAGGLPYEADKAFARDEVDALGRAARLALHRDDAWLTELLPPLVRGVAVAPTTARSLPSQALLYELARAVEDFPTPEALAALRGGRAVARHKGVHKQLDRMLRRIERALADRPEVALRMPDLGFGPDGVRTVGVGDCQAVLSVADRDVGLAWRRADGKLSATVPAALRRDHPDEVKAARDLAKQARGQLTTLARALEAGYAAESARPYRRWRDELAANGLGWSVARRLIWEVEEAPGAWRAVLPGADGALDDVTGAPVAAPAADAGVRLWHPIRAGVDDIRAWRDLLTERRVRQPFKQAFREIYLLTPAEEETRTYSNRFAAHVVYYRQLYALVNGRGWTTPMLGPWDGGDTGEAEGFLAGGTWRVGLRHDYLDRQPSDDGVECAGTDRVWFDRLRDGAWRTAPLAEVPPVVFSEAMRDVDLFVSVTSIAADPTWVDRGDDYGRYWRGASTAELTATAKVRRAALERVIPRTRIADRCTLTDRYLVVRGELRTYKIHLGSANILMEPDDRYLCIVPASRATPDRLFLPFEEDRLTLILSKAFLLADDASITDASITAQIRRAAAS